MMVGPLKLVIMVKDASAVEGGKALMLCTEDGEVVGRQLATVVSSEVGDMGTITVRFLVDGDTIRFADNDG